MLNSYCTVEPLLSRQCGPRTRKLPVTEYIGVIGVPRKSQHRDGSRNWKGEGGGGSFPHTCHKPCLL